MTRHVTLARMHGCMVALVNIDNVAHQYSRVVFENDGSNKALLNETKHQGIKQGSRTGPQNGPPDGSRIDKFRGLNIDLTSKIFGDQFWINSGPIVDLKKYTYKYQVQIQVRIQVQLQMHLQVRVQVQVHVQPQVQL